LRLIVAFIVERVKPAMSHNRGLDRDKDGVACEKS
jgi:hypothetical protein